MTKIIGLIELDADSLPLCKELIEQISSTGLRVLTLWKETTG